MRPPLPPPTPVPPAPFSRGQGSRLRQAMKERNISTAELAAKVGVSEATINNWLSDRHNLNRSNARRVAKALEVSHIWMQFGDDKESERVAQTGKERNLLRMFRDLDEPEQAATLKFISGFGKTEEVEE